MRAAARGLVAVTIAVTLSQLVAACGDRSPRRPPEGGITLPDTAFAGDTLEIVLGGAPVRRAYLTCPGGTDRRASARVDAAAGGSVSTPGANPHTLTVPAGALAVSAVVHIMDAAHRRHMKVRVGTFPSQALAAGVTLTFDLSRCREVPARLELVREDNATFAGSAPVVDDHVSFLIGELSTYVLAAPGTWGDTVPD